MKHVYILLTAIVLSSSCVFDRHGLVEAIFRLSETSRLPAWVNVPEGVSRDQITVDIVEYQGVPNLGWKMRIVARYKHGRTIQAETGYGFWHPDSLREEHPGTLYPNWIIIDVKGIKEVYESAAAPNILSIVDKPIPANYHYSDAK